MCCSAVPAVVASSRARVQGEARRACARSTRRRHSRRPPRRCAVSRSSFASSASRRSIVTPRRIELQLDAVRSAEQRAVGRARRPRRRLSSARPETIATRVSSAAARRSIAARARSVARASSGRSTSGRERAVEVERDEQPLGARDGRDRGLQRVGDARRDDARARERLEERRRPLGDVVLAHAPAQGAHASGALALRHLDRLDHRVLQSLDVVRVHEDRLPQLVGRPGELAEQRARRRASNRHATYSFATRFMPSRSAVTSMTSAAR